MVGCESAEFLAEGGSQVTILEMLGEIGADFGPSLRPPKLARLEKAGVRMEAGVEVVEITEKGVKGLRYDAFDFFEGDTIVLAVGMKSNRRFAQRLDGRVKELHFIGDCVEPRKIKDAIADGFRVAHEI